MKAKIYSRNKKIKTYSWNQQLIIAKINDLLNQNASSKNRAASEPIILRFLYLFSILSTWRIQTLNQIGRMPQEQGVTCSTRNHRQHRQPHVGQRLGRKTSITDAQHVRHRFEQRPWVLFQPERLLYIETNIYSIVLLQKIVHSNMWRDVINLYFRELDYRN